MKRTFLIFFIVAFTTTAFSQTGWFRLNPNVSGKFKDVVFLSSNKGFLLTNSPAKLYVTENGGTSWLEKSLPSCTNCIYTFQKIYFHDSQVGYIRGSSFDGANAKNIVLKTINSGDSWVTETSSTPHPFPFPAPSVNVAYSMDQNHFNKTTDGGLTWNVVDTIFSIDGKYRAFDFRDENNVITIGSSGEPLNYGIQTTTDAGTTWVWRDVTGLPSYSVPFYHAKALPNNVYLLGGYYGPIYHTNDNGETWTKVSANSSGLFEFFNSKIGYTGGNFKGYVQRTTDGGATWAIQNVENQLNSRWLAISAPSELTAYALANDSSLFKTTDGGIGSQLSVSITSPKSQSFRIAENPVSREAKFTFEQSSFKRTIEIIDVLGKVCVSEEIRADQSSLSLDIHTLLPGIYFCRVDSEIVKFVVLDTF